jgi:hypothetical protein
MRIGFNHSSGFRPPANPHHSGAASPPWRPAAHKRQQIPENRTDDPLPISASQKNFHQINNVDFLIDARALAP